jgi:hypothetical protein
MAEKIQPENNRTFKTGSGDWTGAFTWHSDTLGGHQGYISGTIDEDNPEAIITLHYPAIQPVPNRIHRFKMSSCLPAFSVTPPFYDWHITDDMGFSYGEVGICPHTPDWRSENGKFEILLGFNIAGAEIKIRIWTPSEWWGEIAFDDFSFKPISHHQFLPILGVG